MAHEKWANRQIAAAIERGIHPLDAVRAMDEFLATLPPGADPSDYIRPARELEQVLPTEAVLADARAAFYSDTEARYARILDAKEEEQ